MLVNCDALLSVFIVLQSALGGSEECMVALAFTTAFDHVNHRALIYNKLRLFGISGSDIDILDEFLLGRSHKVCGD